jgi:putative membrane protein
VATETKVTTDLLLAIAHHLLIFGLVAVLAAEIVLVRPGLGGNALVRLGGLDRAYGMLAGLILIVGFSRVFFGLKGWEYYIYYWVFWAKIAAFAIVGLLSIPPTLRIAEWSRKAKAEPGHVVPDTEVASVRAYLRAEGAVFVLIPIFAAAMARGIG